jgi:hypothetical protein
MKISGDTDLSRRSIDDEEAADGDIVRFIASISIEIGRIYNTRALAAA